MCQDLLWQAHNKYSSLIWNLSGSALGLGDPAQPMAGIKEASGHFRESNFNDIAARTLRKAGLTHHRGMLYCLIEVRVAGLMMLPAVPLGVVGMVWASKAPAVADCC